jgi:hypothetical protein
VQPWAESPFFGVDKQTLIMTKEFMFSSGFKTVLNCANCRLQAAGFGASWSAPIKIQILSLGPRGLGRCPAP